MWTKHTLRINNITSDPLPGVHYSSLTISVTSYLNCFVDNTPTQRLCPLFTSVLLIANHRNSKWKEMRIDPFSLFQSITNSNTDNNLRKIGLFAIYWTCCNNASYGYRIK